MSYWRHPSFISRGDNLPLASVQESIWNDVLPPQRGKEDEGGTRRAGMHAVSYYGIQCHRRLRYLDSSAGDRPHSRVHTCVRKRSRRPIVYTLIAMVSPDGSATRRCLRFSFLCSLPLSLSLPLFSSFFFFSFDRWRRLRKSPGFFLPRQRTENICR